MLSFYFLLLNRWSTHKYLTLHSDLQHCTATSSTLLRPPTLYSDLQHSTTTFNILLRPPTLYSDLQHSTTTSNTLLRPPTLHSDLQNSTPSSNTLLRLPNTLLRPRTLYSKRQRLLWSPMCDPPPSNPTSTYIRVDTPTASASSHITLFYDFMSFFLVIRAHSGTVLPSVFV